MCNLYSIHLRRLVSVKGIKAMVECTIINHNQLKLMKWQCFAHETSPLFLKRLSADSVWPQDDIFTSFVFEGIIPYKLLLFAQFNLFSYNFCPITNWVGEMLLSYYIICFWSEFLKTGTVLEMLLYLVL